MERGLRSPTIRPLLKVTQALGVQPSPILRNMEKLQKETNRKQAGA